MLLGVTPYVTETTLRWRGGAGRQGEDVYGGSLSPRPSEATHRGPLLAQPTHVSAGESRLASG